MEFRISRRKMMQGVGAAAVAQSVKIANAAPPARQWPIEEGPDTPKICLGLGDGGAAGGPPAAGAGAARAANRGSGFGGTLAPRPETAQTAAAPAGRGAAGSPAAYQRISQLGVTHVVGVSVGGFPWREENVRGAIQTAKDHGLVAYNAMIGIPSTILYGRDGRDKDMELTIASIQAAGKAGLPVI